MPPSESGPRPPESAGEALARARSHAQRALAETVAALEALLDAACLAGTGASGRETAPPVAAALAELRRLLGDESPSSDRLVTALLEALEAEIARWEARGAEDPEARAVLRAFLGMREILWELGFRAPRQEAPSEPAPARPRRRPRKANLQRVRVEG